MNSAEIGREHRITRAFVSLADTLVDEYDVIDLLDRLVGYTVELLAADAADIVLADGRGELRAVAASSESAQLMELFDSGAFRSVHALPLRLRGEAIGALNLFHHPPGPFPPVDLSLGQALADVATIGILSERAVRHGEIRNEQLQSALNSRVIIEQAKGVLTQRGNLSMDAAFDRLRSYARNRNLRLSEVGRQVVENDLADDVLGTRVGRTQRRR